MTDHEAGTTRQQHPTTGPPRRRADIVRHVVDGVSAPAAFLFVEARQGPQWGAVTALLVALVIGVIRRHRGDSLAVVTLATAIVAFHSVSAIAFGEGRAFYFPELVVNAVGLLVCAVTLLTGRPVTETVCRRIGTEPARTAGDPSARRRHRRLTAGWALLWAVHLVPLGYLYAIDSLVGLTLLSALFCKPTMLAMAVLTAVAVRRAVRAEPVVPPAPAPLVDTRTDHAVPHRKDPS